MPAPSLLPTGTAPSQPGEFKADASLPFIQEGAGRVAVWRSIVLLVLTFVVTCAYWFDPPMNTQSMAGVVMKLPPIVGDYYGKLGDANAVERGILPVDTEFARRFYADTQGHEIEVTIVLSGAEQRSIHRPEACMTSQGWSLTGQETIPIQLQSGRTLMARRLTLERDILDSTNQRVRVRALYIYWFIGQNTTTSSEMHRVLLSNWDRVMHNRAHRWAYVSVFSLVTDNLRLRGLDAAQTQQIMTDFTSKVIPTFQLDEMSPQAANKK